MKKILIGLLLLGLPTFLSAQNQITDLKINDSLSIHVGKVHFDIYNAKADSTNRLVADCGTSRYFRSGLISLYYLNGVAYLLGHESMTLFMVNFEGTKNKVTLGKLKLKSNISLKKFERKNKNASWIKTREIVERKPGVQEVVYTIYQDETNLRYRVFFRDGKIHSLMLYIPCKPQ